RRQDRQVAGTCVARLRVRDHFDGRGEKLAAGGMVGEITRMMPTPPPPPPAPLPPIGADWAAAPLKPPSPPAPRPIVVSVGPRAALFSIVTSSPQRPSDMLPAPPPPAPPFAKIWPLATSSLGV